MGGADVIPGVSGGTVALILGIYARLVTAISHFDHRLLNHLRRGQWFQAARHVDLRFLSTIGGGIALGVVSLGELMNGLLSSAETRPVTLSAFFGMILASSFLVARMISIASRGHLHTAIAIGIAGFVVAFVVTGLGAMHVEITLAYVFLCGLIAICAMILPGISGAYLLLIMGVYLHLTGILKAMRRFDITRHDVLTVGVFAAGCAIGIVIFSKILRRLLTAYESQTMALLSGFMLGALRRIWPFQVRQPAGSPASSTAHEQIRNVLPKTFDGSVLLCIVVACLALVLVLLLDKITRSGRVESPESRVQS